MTVLLWTVTYGSLQVEECDDLDEAIGSAWGKTEGGYASIVGAEVLDENRWVDRDTLSSAGDRRYQDDGESTPNYVAKVCLAAPTAAGSYAGKPAPLLWVTSMELAERHAATYRTTYGSRVSIEPIR
jgi:hypothetical protein